MEENDKSLSFMQSLGEARMYKSRSQIASNGARSITDHAFVSLLSLYAMSQDYESAPVATKYAKSTISRGSFSQPSPGAMKKYLAQAWAKRKPGIAVSTPEQALILASIVEKETGKAEERRMVAGVYSNRLKRGMPLQADPTVIYPVTKGKPLGRRILRSELQDKNGYNTYASAGLPIGPIANPGRASIDAVLDPAETNAFYFVADGTGGHIFADTLEQHNANVQKWYALRRARGEM